jgi:hypothetical protein
VSYEQIDGWRHQSSTSKFYFPKICVLTSVFLFTESPAFRRLSYDSLEFRYSTDVYAVNKLKKYAINLYSGGDGGEWPVVSTNVENWNVVLQYTDKDGDRNLIFTDWDILEAMKEYADVGRVKILAQVKPQHQAEDTANTSTQTFVLEHKDASTETTEEVPKEEPEVKEKEQPKEEEEEEEERAATTSSRNLEEQIADLLNFAAVTVSAAAAKSSHQAQRIARKAARAAEKIEREALRKADIAEKKVEAFNKSVNGACDKKKPEAEDKKPEAVAEERPFIHGRHTCDGCLTTPIVGKRFHATNLPDYDLCADCHRNYSNEEIKFEEVELGT